MLHYLLAAASIVIIIAGLKISNGIVGPILFAFTLTLLIVPLLQWLKKKGLPSWLAITTLFSVFLLGFWLVLLLVYTSTQQLIDNIPNYQTQLEKQLTPLQSTVEGLEKQWGVETNIGIPRELQNGSTIARTSLSVLSSILESGANIGFFLFTLLLMVIASDNVIKKSKKYFATHKHFAAQFRDWSANIQQQYKIQTISNFLSGLVATAVFLIMGIDFALLWGLLAFLLAYIPNIGIIIASVPPILLAFIEFGPLAALTVAAIIIALNIVMDNVVTPRFMGEGLKIPASVVFLSFIFWSYVFGLLGAFLALPITLAIRSILLQSNKTRYIGELLSS